MRSFTIFVMSGLLSTTAFAGRSGTDERIHMCTSSADSKLLGKNQKYRAHITADKEIKLTRLKGQKVLLAKVNNSSVYVFDDVKSFWKDGKIHSGYLEDVNKDGELAVLTRASSSSYDSDKLDCQLVRVISELDPLSPTEESLIKIGDTASDQLGNGGYDFSKFDLKKFDVEVEKTKFNKKRWKDCKWEMKDDKKEAYEEIKTHAEDPDVVGMLKDLDKEVGIKQILSLISDDQVECSNRFFWIYTDDGYKLELLYQQGD